MIGRPAGQINLQLSDLGETFALTEELGTAEWVDSTTRDGNRRAFESNDGVFVESTVLVMRFLASDSVEEVMTAVEENLEASLSSTQTIAFLPTAPLSLGDRGGIEQFFVDSAGADGYIVVLIRQNVALLLIEFGPSGVVGREDVLAHAEIMDLRLR